MKKNCIIILFALTFCLSVVTMFPVKAANILLSNDEISQNSSAESSSLPDERQLPRLVDNAELLTSSKAQTLLSKLDEISERQQFDIVVVTVNALQGKTPQAYADDFYDFNGFGFGVNKDGVLLLVSMEDRDWWISTSGFGITAITDAGIDYMSDKFLPAMSDGDYAGAFTKFAELCDQFISQAKADKPYDVDNLPKEAVSLWWIPGAISIGAVLAILICLIMKGKLKSVRYQPTANNYVRQGSISITDRRDIFLYSHVSRRARPKDTGPSGSGGSRTHTSSSGRSHGGRGGKF